MTTNARLWVLVAVLATLAGCGPASNTATPQAAAANATAGLAAPQTPDTAILPLMPDPDHDLRPDGVKAGDFTGHLQRISANMAAVDAAFLSRIRAAMEAGSQADAKQLVTDYRGLIAADIAALPASPHLAGCYAKAAPLNASAESAVAAPLSDRRDKADAVATISDRPLSLADFGALATDFATGAGAQSSIAAARAATAGCHDTPAHSQAAAPPRAQSLPPAAPPPSKAPAKPPPKKGSFFQRLFGN
jgi:hypothetical protein